MEIRIEIDDAWKSVLERTCNKLDITVEEYCRQVILSSLTAGLFAKVEGRYALAHTVKLLRTLKQRSPAFYTIILEHMRNLAETSGQMAKFENFKRMLGEAEV